MTDDEPLLLHSLAEFRSIVRPLLDAVAPKALVEIGGEGGQFTGELSAWAAEHGVDLYCVEPGPSPALRALEADGGVTIVRGKSPGALAEVPPTQLAVIDGDHNYHVVHAELTALLAAEPPPVLVLHDVAWPAARRDQYYDPADVPEEARRPYDGDLGAVPGQTRLQPTGGFRGEGAFAYALEEGGPRNGVLTAVEDVLAGRDDLEFRRIPAIFGFGVVFPSAAPFAGALRELLDPLHEHDLLDRLERNRVRLFLAMVKARDERAVHARGVDALIAGLEREVAALRVENARLRDAAATTLAAGSSSEGPPEGGELRAPRPPRAPSG